MSIVLFHSYRKLNFLNYFYHYRHKYSNINIDDKNIIYKDDYFCLLKLSILPNYYEFLENDNFFMIAFYPIFHLNQLKQLLDTNIDINLQNLREKILEIEMFQNFFIIIDKKTKNFISFNDKCGYARIYICKHKHGLLLTDNYTLLIQLFPNQWRRNYLNLINFASVGWMPSSSTLVQTINHIEPGFFLKGIINLPCKNNIITDGYDSIFNLTQVLNSNQRNSNISTIIYALKSCFESYKLRCGDCIKASITGGRDSRTLASIILNYFKINNIEFTTINNFDDETNIVLELLREYLSKNIKLKINNPAKRDLIFNKEAADYLFNITGGFFEPGIITNSIDSINSRYNLNFGISGAGGEMLHAFYYPKDSCMFSYEDILNYLSWRLVSWTYSKYDLKSIIYTVVENDLNKFIHITNKNNLYLNPYKFFDYFIFKDYEDGHHFQNEKV